MSQGPLCPNLTKKVQKEVSQMANRNLSCVMLLGGLSVTAPAAQNRNFNDKVLIDGGLKKDREYRTTYEQFVQSYLCSCFTVVVGSFL